MHSVHDILPNVLIKTIGLMVEIMLNFIFSTLLWECKVIHFLLYWTFWVTLDGWVSWTVANWWEQRVHNILLKFEFLIYISLYVVKMNSYHVIYWVYLWTNEWVMCWYNFSICLICNWCVICFYFYYLVQFTLWKIVTISQSDIRIVIISWTEKFYLLHNSFFCTIWWKFNGEFPP